MVPELFRRFLINGSGFKVLSESLNQRPRKSFFREIVLKPFNEKGSGIVESLIVLIVISILVVVVMDRYETIIAEAKKVALKSELNNIRQAILVFKIKTGRYPASFKELVTTHYVVPYKDTVISAKYLEPYSLDKDKNILDSFDLPLAYDPATGRVWSIKKGFENW